VVLVTTEVELNSTFGMSYTPGAMTRVMYGSTAPMAA
jgi:hypothetical protein